ncbi:DUF4375 domain-containing protein [Candidatus Dojkabacteria bacterium]|uniref:DUF4375 domain-containing protein n=1 Tax=Candidatus Dojkabacteria bacterium TaxID=2099670 RepID=A0A955L4T7_9BACT|nr:DUF4375 domain-containing protein [Candidatus Dojkabacteria bacterium]
MIKKLTDLIRKKPTMPRRGISSILLISSDLEKKKALKEYIDELEHCIGFENFTGVEKILYTTIHLLYDTKRGGFAEFFLNNSRYLVKVTLAALQKLNATEPYNKVKEALRLIPAEVLNHEDYEFVEQIITSLPNNGTAKMDKLSKEFIDLHDEIEELLVSYINGNVSKFTETN